MNLPFERKRILCPYCMRLRRLGPEIVTTHVRDNASDDRASGGPGTTPGKVYTCGGSTGCGSKIPVAYIDDYDTVPRVYCPLGGLPNHGKTVYLVSLLVALADFGPRLWGTSNLPQGEGIHDVIEWMRVWRTEGRLPRRNVFLPLPNCIVLRISGFPQMPPFHLMLQDVSGEVIHEEPRIRDARFLTDAPVLVLFVSLPDLRQDGLQMNESVLGLYMNALRSKNQPIGTQSLLVVLTKGDELLDPGSDLPRQARAALGAAPEELYGHGLAADRERREELSEALERWLLRQPNYGGAVLSAREVFTDVKYCVVSATGGPTVQRDDSYHYLNGSASPRAIFDPLRWIVDLQADRTDQLRLTAEVEEVARRASPEQAEDVEAVRANLRAGNLELAGNQLRRLRKSLPRRRSMGWVALLLVGLAAAGVVGWRWLGWQWPGL